MLIPLLTIVQHELRLLKRDPTPFTILFIMPAVSLLLFTPTLGALLREQGHLGASGIELALPGITVMFGSLGAAFLGFAIFREHQWHSWSRLLTSPTPIISIILGKMLLPIALVVGQQVVLLLIAIFIYSSALPHVASYLLHAAAFSCVIAALGLLTTVCCRSLQQVNAITHVLALLLAASSGAFLTVETMPSWIQWLVVLTPSYWLVDSQMALLIGSSHSPSWTAISVMLVQAALLMSLAIIRFKSDEY